METMLKTRIKHGISIAMLVGRIGFYSFAGGYVTLYLGSTFLSEHITNQTQLMVMLQEEKDILGIPDKRIYARLEDAPGFPGRALRLGEGSYEIVLNSGGKNRANLRHELYHIYDGHVEDLAECSNGIEAVLKFIFIQEPQALLYQLLGIRL